MSRKQPAATIVSIEQPALLPLEDRDLRVREACQAVACKKTKLFDLISTGSYLDGPVRKITGRSIAAERRRCFPYRARPTNATHCAPSSPVQVTAPPPASPRAAICRSWRYAVLSSATASIQQRRWSATAARLWRSTFCRSARAPGLPSRTTRAADRPSVAGAIGRQGVAQPRRLRGWRRGLCHEPRPPDELAVPCRPPAYAAAGRRGRERRAAFYGSAYQKADIPPPTANWRAGENSEATNDGC